MRNLNDSLENNNGRRLTRDLALLAMLGLLAKIIWLMFDKNNLAEYSFYLCNDSGAYANYATLRDAVDGNRPKGYTFFLRAIWMLGNRIDFNAVVLWQSAIALALPLTVFWFCRRGFGVPRGAAFVLAGICLISPRNLVLERYILSETFAMFLLCVCLWLFARLIWRPSVGLGLALGLALAALNLTRLAWWFMLPLIFVLGVMHLWLEGRLRSWRLIPVALVLILSYEIPYKAYCYWYALHLEGNTNYVAQGASRMGGRVLWARVSCLAGPHDLDGYDWGRILLSNMESLKRHPDFQTWDPQSTASLLARTYCRNNISDYDKLLGIAGKRVLLHHPFGLMGLTMTTARDYLGSRIEIDMADRNNGFALQDYSRDFYANAAGVDLTAYHQMPNTNILPFYMWWGGTRKFFILALLTGFVVALCGLRRRMLLFEISSIGLAYFSLTCVATFMDDRYFQPAEMLALIAAGGVIAPLWNWAARMDQKGWETAEERDAIAAAPVEPAPAQEGDAKPEAKQESKISPKKNKLRK